MSINEGVLHMLRACAFGHKWTTFVQNALPLGEAHFAPTQNRQSLALHARLDRRLIA